MDLSVDATHWLTTKMTDDTINLIEMSSRCGTGMHCNTQLAHGISHKN